MLDFTPLRHAPRSGPAGANGIQSLSLYLGVLHPEPTVDGNVKKKKYRLFQKAKLELSALANIYIEFMWALQLFS